MPVYNEIDYDGRVQRAAECLAENHSVTLFAVNSHSGYRNSKFSLCTVSLSWLGTRGLVRFACYCAALIYSAVRARPHIVYAHDYFTAWPGYIAAALTGAALVYDSHELIVPEDGFKLSHRDMFFYRLEKSAVRRAALIVAANEERAEIMRKHYRLASTPVAIHNITSPPMKSPDPETALDNFPMLRRSSSKVVRLVFQGFLSADRGVVASVKALAQLPTEFELVLVGGGPPMDIAAIYDAVAEHGLGDRVLFLGRVPRERLHDILATCDIGIVYYHTRKLNHLYCASNKTYEYAQAGLPMVLTCQPPLRQLSEVYGVGELIGCEVVNKGEKVREIADMVRACQTIAANLDSYRANLPRFLNENRWEDEAKRLLEAVNDVRLVS